jgi:hypothetical protein
VPVHRTSRRHDDAASRRGASASQSFLTTGSAEKEWQCDILLCGEFRDELTELEDEAEAITSQPRALPFAHRVKALAFEADLTGVRNKDARKTVQQRRLA